MKAKFYFKFFLFAHVVFFLGLSVIQVNSPPFRSYVLYPGGFYCCSFKVLLPKVNVAADGSGGELWRDSLFVDSILKAQIMLMDENVVRKQIENFTKTAEIEKLNYAWILRSIDSSAASSGKVREEVLSHNEPYKGQLKGLVWP